MKTLLLGLGVFFGVILVIVLLFGAWMIYSFVFIGHQAERQVSKTDPYQALTDGVSISDIPYAGPTLERDYGRPFGIDGDPNGKWLLLDNNTLKAGQRVMIDDPGKPVYRLALAPSSLSPIGISDPAGEDDRALIFSGSKVFSAVNNRVGAELADLSNYPIGGTGYARWLNDQYMVVGGYLHTDKGTRTPLWQISYPDFSATPIVDDTFYLHVTVPAVYRFPEQNLSVLVYFTGSIAWGFGGDVNKPEYSVIRVYNDRWPAGQDIARFGFSSGIVRSVAAETTDDGQSTLVVLTDPTRPSGVEGSEVLPPKQWRVGF